MKKIREYFIRIYRAIFNIKEGVKIEKKPLTKTEAHLDKMERLDHLNVDHIKKIMDMTKIDVSANPDEVQEQFIKNRESINEYKAWYHKLVGYNRPDGFMKKIIEADLKLDRVKMDMLHYEMQERDNERFEAIEAKEKEEIFQHSTSVEDKGEKLKRILSGAKELINEN
jgi:hypothetical protein